MKKYLLLLIIPFISFSQDNNDDMNYDYLKKRELNYDPNLRDFNRTDIIRDNDFWANYLQFYPPQPEFKGAKRKLKKNINEIDLFSYHPFDIDNMSEKEMEKYVEKNTTIIELTVDELKELTRLSLLPNISSFEKAIEFQISSCVVNYYSGSEDYFSWIPFLDEKMVKESSLRRGELKPIRDFIENAKPGDFLRFDKIKANLYYNKKLNFSFRVEKKIVLKVV